MLESCHNFKNGDGDTGNCSRYTDGDANDASSFQSSSMVVWGICGGTRGGTCREWSVGSSCRAIDAALFLVRSEGDDGIEGVSRRCVTLLAVVRKVTCSFLEVVAATELEDVACRVLDEGFIGAEAIVGIRGFQWHCSHRTNKSQGRTCRGSVGCR